MKTPHKHAELIKAWADGAEIEVSMDGSHWSDCLGAPSFNVNFKYRIKPEPKPDVIRYGLAIVNNGICLTYPAPPKTHNNDDNLKLVFDGETGKLIDAEVIS